MTKHVYKVGMMLTTRLIEAPSAAAAVMFFGVNLITTNNPFAVICYEEDSQPWAGDSFWFTLAPTKDHVNRVLECISREDIMACRVVNEASYVADMACIHVSPDAPPCDACSAALGLSEPEA